ncbi:MAG: M23 family metallopeptidase [Candidatus Cryptobacteroides sp.]
MSPKYIFDPRSASFQKVTHSIGHTLWNACKWLVGTISLAAFCYVLVSLFISTDTERALARENRMYERLYRELSEKERILSLETEALMQRDNEIYRQIFNTTAPEVDPVSVADFSMVADSVEEKNVVAYTARKAEILVRSALSVEDNFRTIFGVLQKEDYVLPPMFCPVEGMSYAQTGASVGQKLSPFYKVPSQHGGLDIIAGQGEDVLASGDGVVVSVVHSGKGLGNVVTIDHGNGFTTRYAHLSDISVHKGSRVTKGKKIGSVGISGNTFAPHLHYEVLLGEEVQDPVYYMFGSLTPAEFASVAFMAAKTEQSLD